MMAFEIWHNGRKVCTAGVGEVGLLLAIARWCRGEDGSVEEADLEVCGQMFATNEHAVWANVPLRRGDEVLIRLVEVGDDDVAAPREQFRTE